MPVVSEAGAVAMAPVVPDASALFPPGVLVLSSALQESLEGLHEAERALIARAVPKRQHEFATGRRLAYELLAQLGSPDYALLADADRTPLWPAGIVGSISHSRGLCVVALAKRSALAGLGVDVEAADGVRPELWRRVLGRDEERWLRARPLADQRGLAAVFFSAKEATYKAVFPLTRVRLGFHDVALELDCERSAFHARVPGFARPLAGGFVIQSPWVLTGLALFAGDAPA